MSKRIKCSSLTANGTPCGRCIRPRDYVPGTAPVCSVHRAVANGTLAGCAQKTLRTPEAIVRKLLDDRDPAVRLRAVEMWQKHFETRTTSDTGYRDLLKALTDDERDHLKLCLDAVAAIKEAVYDRNPDLTPDERTLARRRQRDAEAHTAAVQAKLAAHPQPSPVVDEPEPVDEDELPEDFDIVSEDEP
jgi:hypothetical protein